MSRHTLSVLVEDKPGVLARIAGLFSRRGFNIESLAVGPTESPDVSRMTIVVNVKVAATADNRGQVLDTVQLFRAKVIDVAADAITIQVTGNAGKIADFLKIMEPFGVRELVQSGMVAIGRGPRSISERSLRPVPIPAPPHAG
jgi:acetolactate synthase-1/3 small subunit